jgi:hypothetical protein
MHSETILVNILSRILSHTFIFIIYIYIYMYTYKSKTCTDTYVYMYIDILYSFDIYPTFLVTFMIAIFRGLSTENLGKRSADPFLWRQWTLPAWASNGGRKWRRFVEGHGCEWNHGWLVNYGEPNHRGLNSNRTLFPNNSQIFSKGISDFWTILV